jgi:prepilin-type N-terminal cleavage/methylation domain-containing protein
MSHATSHPQPTTSSPSPNLHAACSPQRKRSAFTLIELLVVIAIIVVLAGLGFAGLQGAIESGKKAQARNDVTQLAAAVKAYQLEYGRLPEQGQIIAALTGENTKELVFFETKAAKGNPPKGGMLDGKLYDPWGQEYTIVLDDNYDNRVSHNGVEHLTTVVVETTPPGSNQKPINNVQ